MSPSFKPATRKGVKPLIGLYAESGCGKTYSALLLARGIAGESGRVGMIDTESGRGSLYADVLPGGYQVMEMPEPFTPANYIEAITAAEEAGFDALVIDSMSHEWEGMGGVQDMATENEMKSGRAGLHNWRTPKMEHNKLVLKLLQTRLAVICCIRAKYKTRQKKENGRTVIVKDDHVSPIQSEEFIFEMTAHAEILQDHTIRLTKCSHPALRDCFPLDGQEPVSVKHGEAIARWALVGSTPTQKAKPKSRKSKLWDITKDIHGGDVGTLEKYLRDTSIIDAEETLAGLSEERLEDCIFKVEDMLASA